ncbi:hypothetical protein [Thermodesulfomicrobium sp. WS]|nr:hypothetical protein [Thermodesulfomicrobium sp. WS]
MIMEILLGWDMGETSVPQKGFGFKRKVWAALLPLAFYRVMSKAPF